MQRFLSRYSAAAHLALLAVAPLFLLPFFGVSATCRSVLWISALAITWLLLEPSRRNGEMLHDARKRVVANTLSDPLFWFSLVVVVFAGLRAINTGIGMKYDAELMNWSVSAPKFVLLPGCAGDVGFFPFVVAVALAIVFIGTRHVLGRSARIAFFATSSVLSGLAGIALAFAISYGNAGALAIAKLSTFNATYFGTVFGIQLLCGVVAIFSVVEFSWYRVEPLVTLGLIGNAIGLVVFSPVVTILLFAAVYLLFVIVSFAILKNRLAGSGSLRCALSISMSLAAPVMYALAQQSDPAIAAKVVSVKTFELFSPDFFSVRDKLSDIALKVWKSNPWLGTGLDSFPISIRFNASPADWTVISPSQKTALSGWWQLLSERGVIGSMMLAVSVGMLLWTYFSRMIGSWRRYHFGSEHFVGPFLLLALTALAFVDCSYLRPEVLLLSGAMLALSGSAFPSRRRSDEDVKES